VIASRNASKPLALVTGGAGFVGTNLSDRLASDGYRVRVLDDLRRPGVEANLAWLRERHPRTLSVRLGDVRDARLVREAVRGADLVCHLAAQVAVTTSLERPLEDFETNVRGTLNLLEALRRSPRQPAFLFTSTNKVYGALADLELVREGDRWEPLDALVRETGIAEERPLAFCTPYGCSKGAADQYVLDYAHCFDLPALVFRMSCIYGPHQHGNEDQGWVAHFLLRALAREPITIYGDGAQVRDVLFVDDLVDAIELAVANVEKLAGYAFNVGGGPANTISLLELVDLIAELEERRPKLTFAPERAGDQRYYVSDTSRLAEATGWVPRVTVREGVETLYRWLSARTREPLRAA
jgi:CDP-paratose 2-epimerase